MCVCGSKATMGTTDSEHKHQNRHVRRRRRRKQQLRQWWEAVFVQEPLFLFYIGTLTFHKNANSPCAYVEAKKQWKRQTQTTNNKNVMQDDDGDEQLSLQTMPINICTRRTLMVVPHWHIDFFKHTTVNVRMRSHNKDGNDRIRRQTTTSSCKTTTAMKNCRYRRCQSAFVHVELSWLFHIGT